MHICIYITKYIHIYKIDRHSDIFTETKKHSPNTGARVPGRQMCRRRKLLPCPVYVYAYINNEHINTYKISIDRVSPNLSSGCE